MLMHCYAVCNGSKSLQMQAAIYCCTSRADRANKQLTGLEFGKGVAQDVQTPDASYKCLQVSVSTTLMWHVCMQGPCAGQ
jgi:hypothetical protein